LITIAADVQMTVNFYLRSGSLYTTNYFYNFLKNTLERLRIRTIELLRVDCGLKDKKKFEYREY
jgi:hypothetical protein